MNILFSVGDLALLTPTAKARQLVQLALATTLQTLFLDPQYVKPCHTVFKYKKRLCQGELSS